MSVLITDFKHRKCTTPALALTTTNVGGAKTAVDIQSATPGDIIPSIASETFGGVDRTVYSKSFVTNTHATDSGFSCKFWLINALDEVVGNAFAAAVSTSPLDDATKKIRYIGFDNAGNPFQYEAAMNGLTQVDTGANLFSYCGRAECRLVSTSALTPTAGDVTIKHGATARGMIPTGMDTATGELQIGMTLAQDDAVTIATAETAPSSVSFFKPRLVGSALNALAGGVIAALVGQGIWWKYFLKAGMKPSSKVTSRLGFEVQAV